MDNLSLDMIECKKAGFGVDYGKWKATQEPAKPIPIQADKNVFYCMNCGRIIIQESRRPRKYCDAYCGLEYRYKRDHGLLEEGVDNGQA